MGTGLLIARMGLFWLLNAAVAGFALAVARGWSGSAALDLAIRVLTIYFFTIILLLTFLGLLHLIYLPVVASLALLLCLTGLFLRRRQAALAAEMPASTEPPRFLSRAFVLTLVLAGITLYLISIIYPHFPHDPLTYHLVFPVEWRQRHGLALVPTPFGDPSRAYDAANVSLYYLWLLLPLGQDQFAQSGQFPFFILCLLALTGVCRELNLKPPWRYLPALLFALTPLASVQASMAFNDLAVAALVLTSLYWILRLRSSRRAEDLYLASISLGLLAGIKYLALLPAAVLGLILIVVLLPIGRAKRVGPLHLALAGGCLILAGGYWYLRNLFFFGNPVYPLEVKLFGHTILAGAYDRAVMLNWVFHQQGFKELKSLLLELTSPPLLIGLLFAQALAPILAWRARRVSGDRLVPFLLALPVALHLLLWYVNPFQIDRFWFPVLALALIPLAWLANYHRMIGWAAVLLAAGDLLSRPAFGLTYPTYWKIHLALVAAGAVLAMPRSLWQGLKLRWKWLASLGMIIAVLASFLYQPSYLKRRAAFLFSQWKPGTAWQWLWAQPGPLRLAYTGTNLVYPLYGPRLENTVRYLNLNHHPGWQFHDYERAYRPGPANTPEPAPYRLEWDLPAWWQNLVQARIQYLIVAGVGKNLRPNIAHDPEFWPIEDQWARTHPRLFERVFANPTTRIYRVHPEVTPAWSEADRQVIHRPKDAIAAYAQDPELGKTYFPQAPPVLKKLK